MLFFSFFVFFTSVILVFACSTENILLALKFTFSLSEKICCDLCSILEATLSLLTHYWLWWPSQNFPILIIQSQEIMLLANFLLVSIRLGASISFPGSNYQGISECQTIKKVWQPKKFVIHFFFLMSWQSLAKFSISLAITSCNSKTCLLYVLHGFQKLKKNQSTSAKFVQDRKLI